MVVDYRFRPFLYTALGYTIEHRSYDVLMVKELSDMSFKEAYGEKFHLSILDFF